MESLPPSLRHMNHHHPTLEHATDDNPNSDPDVDPVPVIDLECLEHEMEKVEEACKHWGLFRLVNHGIPPTLLGQLDEQAKKLFSLPFETKQASCNNDGTPTATYFWGTPALTPSGSAITSGTQNVNLVEGFSFNLGQLSLFHPQLHELHSFRVLLVEYGKHLSRIATTLFEAMVKRLELKVEGSLRSYLAENKGDVRVYRYPSWSVGSVGWGIEEHTDSSVLSILNQDDEVSGLEVLKDDQWLTVKPITNTLIVNIGDMMQAMSDDRFKSVFHRVKVNNHKERISICYFVFPEEDAEIKSSKYKPFTYNEFRAQVQEDIKITGRKVGLARFKRN